jgi:hypothetical protein
MGYFQPSGTFGPTTAHQPLTADVSNLFNKKSFSIFKMISEMIYKWF